MKPRTLLIAARVVAKTCVAVKAGNLAYLNLLLNDEELALLGDMPPLFVKQITKHRRWVALVVFSVAYLA